MALRLAWGSGSEAVNLKASGDADDAGSVFDFDSSYIHGVRHAGGPPATSLHAYSPALWRMGHYELGQKTGALGRISITYADELASAG